MKFQKGILSDDEANEGAIKPVLKLSTPVQNDPVLEPEPQPQSQPRPIPLPVVEKEHLFETVRERTGSVRKYISVLGVVAVGIIGISIAIAYYTLPKVGDAIRAPKGLEAAVRDHFLINEKRTATDITFYRCDKFIWARVAVEKRLDIKTNPLYAIGSYSARATPTGEATWTIITAPITSPEMDVPCS